MCETRVTALVVLPYPPPGALRTWFPIQHRALFAPGLPIQHQVLFVPVSMQHAMRSRVHAQKMEAESLDA